MIDYIKYTVDGKTYQLVNNGDGTWSKEVNAPSVAGNYNLLLEISKEGIITLIDSSDPRYNLYLKVIISAERVTYLQDYVPELVSSVEQMKIIYEIENINFDRLHSDIEGIKSDAFLSRASNEAILRTENFIKIKGLGTLEQRRSYLKSLIQKGSKLNETSIKDVVKIITGSECLVNFFGADEIGNPEPGNSLLRIQVFSPSNYKEYRYEDIERALKPLVPGHIKLSVVRFFSTWGDISINFADWNSIKNNSNWEYINNYISPR